MDPQLARAMQSLTALNPTVKSNLINAFTQSVKKAVEESEAVARTQALNQSGVATNAQGQPVGEAGQAPGVPVGNNTMPTSGVQSK